MSPSQLIGVEPMNMIGCFPTDKSQMFVCDFIFFNSVKVCYCGWVEETFIRLQRAFTVDMTSPLERESNVFFSFFCVCVSTVCHLYRLSSCVFTLAFLLYAHTLIAVVCLCVESIACSRLSAASLWSSPPPPPRTQTHTSSLLHAFLHFKHPSLSYGKEPIRLESVCFKQNGF